MTAEESRYISEVATRERMRLLGFIRQRIRSSEEAEDPVGDHAGDHQQCLHLGHRTVGPSVESAGNSLDLSTPQERGDLMPGETHLR